MGENVIEAVKKCVLSHFQREDVQIYLFGSWARGEQKRSSDIDIAIESKQDMAYKVSLLREKLEESVIPRRVDVVDMNHAGRVLCQRIRKEGILWKKFQNESH